jgi:hypothetical protein
MADKEKQPEPETKEERAEVAEGAKKEVKKLLHTEDKKAD